MARLWFIHDLAAHNSIGECTTRVVTLWHICIGHGASFNNGVSDFMHPNHEKVWRSSQTDGIEFTRKFCNSLLESYVKSTETVLSPRFDDNVDAFLQSTMNVIYCIISCFLRRVYYCANTTLSDLNNQVWGKRLGFWRVVSRMRWNILNCSARIKLRPDT